MNGKDHRGALHVQERRVKYELGSGVRGDDLEAVPGGNTEGGDHRLVDSAGDGFPLLNSTGLVQVDSDKGHWLSFLTFIQFQAAAHLATGEVPGRRIPVGLGSEDEAAGQAAV